MNSLDLRSRRTWALATLVAVTVVGFQPFFLRVLRVDGEAAARQYDELPFRRLPGIHTLVDEVRNRVQKNERIAYWTPYPGWWEGYSFSYMRAAYLLAGYRLDPLLDAKDKPHPEFLEEVNWVLAVGGDLELDGFETVASTDNGRLLRRTR